MSLCQTIQRLCWHTVEWQTHPEWCYCVFMLGVLAFNPFSAIFGKLGSEQGAYDYTKTHGARMLHGWDEIGML